VSGEAADGGNSFVLRFPTLLNRIYRVHYSSDMKSWKTSEPAVIGTGSEVQWIDFGPPRTDSRPDAMATRYYRLLFLP
jgi:hypothetical protein